MTNFAAFRLLARNAVFSSGSLDGLWKRDVVDFQAGGILAQRQLGIDGDAVGLEFEIKHDFRLGVPIEAVIAADAEIHRAWKEVEFSGR